MSAAFLPRRDLVVDPRLRGDDVKEDRGDDARDGTGGQLLGCGTLQADSVSLPPAGEELFLLGRQGVHAHADGVEFYPGDLVVYLLRQEVDAVL